MSHQSKVPAVAAAYFRSQVLRDHLEFEDHPQITSYFVPGRGWRRYIGIKYVSATWLRKMRARGATDVVLTLNGRSADFTIAELVATATRTPRL